MMNLADLIDLALDARAREWYQYNEGSGTTTIIQTKIVEIVMDVLEEQNLAP